MLNKCLIYEVVNKLKKQSMKELNSLEFVYGLHIKLFRWAIMTFTLKQERGWLEDIYYRIVQMWTIMNAGNLVSGGHTAIFLTFLGCLIFLHNKKVLKTSRVKEMMSRLQILMF